MFNNPQTVHDAGMSVQGIVVSEKDVAEEDLENHIVYLCRPDNHRS